MDNALLKIRLLGCFEIAYKQERVEVSDWSRRKAATLIQYLVLQKQVVKEQIIELLWPEVDISSGSNNLYRTLYAVRKTIDDKFGKGMSDNLFSFKLGILSLNPDVWVDVHEFEELCTHLNVSALETQAEQIAYIQKAYDLYQGDLIPDDPYSDWIIPYRENLRELYHKVNYFLVDYFKQGAKYDHAIQILNPLLRDDSGNEGVHRELMRLYVLNGQRHKALRQYKLCVETIQQIYNDLPEPETETLYQQILTDEIVQVATIQNPNSELLFPPAWESFEVERNIPFVGRDEELKTITSYMNKIQNGTGCTFLLAGDTGVGKTRLAYEALSAIDSRQIVTLLGSFYEQEGRLPYQAFVDAINYYLLKKSLPLANNPITSNKNLKGNNLEQDHSILFNNVVNFLVNISCEQPIALFIDDLHAADETSLHLFHFLARKLQSFPVALLATYRTDIKVEPTSPFGILLNSLYRERLQKIVSIQPLKQDATSEIVAHILEGTPSSKLAEDIFRFSEGNPFCTQETTYSILDQDRVEIREEQWQLKPDVSLNIPSGLSGVMLERIAGLGENVIAALELAAIIGRDFSYEILRNIQLVSEDKLLDFLDTALESRFLEESATGYRFKHGFIRRVLYEKQSQQRRKYLHSKVALAIEASASDTKSYSEILAHHYIRSDRRRDALPYLVQSGKNAVELFAFEVAIGYFEDAIKLLDEFQINDLDLRWELLESLGSWNTLLANTIQAIDWFEQALALKETDDWKPDLGNTIRVRRLAAVALNTTGKMQQAENHLVTALALIDPKTDSEEHAYLLYYLSQVYWHRNDYEQSIDVAQCSLDVAKRLDDSAAIARAYEMLALACHATGNWREGLEYEEKRAMIGGTAIDVADAFDVHL